jgi:NDP-sugar pyrophosphorylase family protein
VNVQVVIPMSGFGERFGAKGYTVPKPLIRVAGAPMIEHVLDMYPTSVDVVFIVNEDHLKNDDFRMGEILTSLRPRAKIVPIASHKSGPSGAVALARDAIDPATPTIVNYCDFTSLWDFDGFVEMLSRCDGVVATYTGFHPHMARSTKFAYVTGDGNRVSGIQEKQPYTSHPMRERASCGTYGFSSGALMLDAIDKQIERNLNLGGEFYTSLTYIPLLDEERDIRSYNINRFFQWGTPEDLEDFVTAFDSFESIGVVRPPRYGRINSVLLAGGLGARFANIGYETPKASLPLSGKPAWMQVVESVRDDREHVTVCRSAVLDTLQAANYGSVVELESLSSGQAASAQIGLEALKPEAGPVLIASCDALFPEGHRSQVNSTVPDITVWVCKSGAKSDSHPEQFAWVRVDDESRVVDFAMKNAPGDAGNWFVVSGTFQFANVDTARSYISTMMLEEIKTNNEYYLDNAIAIALRNGASVMADIRTDFVGLGTPEEYESFRYWQGTFHHWRHSSYELTHDWMVSESDIDELLAQSLVELNTPLSRFDG